jgi:type I restriction enzyme M protein
VVEQLTDVVQALADKYAVTYTETTQQLTKAEHSLADMISDLTGDDFDMQGLAQFQSLLREDT